MYQQNTALQEVITSNHTYYLNKQNVSEPLALFPHQKLSQLCLDLHIASHLERTYCLITLLEIAYPRYKSHHPYKIKRIYHETAVALNKNVNTIKSNVRICIQDIAISAPDDILHSIFFVNREELATRIYPKFFITRILDYLDDTADDKRAGF